MGFLNALSLLCFRCRQSVITELDSSCTAVKALNGFWHPHCFQCHVCLQPISAQFIEMGCYPYHFACYIAAFRPRCAKCGETLMNHCLLAMNRHWHLQCFTCTYCGVIINQTFRAVREKPYHPQCFGVVDMD